MPETCRIEPITAQRWPDFEEWFGARGGCDGCRCIHWKLQSKSFDALLYEGNRKAQRAIVESGVTPGLVAFRGSKPVGWIVVEPRSSDPRLVRSRVRGPVDDRPVWSVACFLVNPNYRRRGITIELLRAAIRHLKERGSRVLEVYPLEAAGEGLPAVAAYKGLVPACHQLGCMEVARYSKRRPIYRHWIGG
jgi:ribosomal protein S18 acetylase RimI-like enzyme